MGQPRPRVSIPLSVFAEPLRPAKGCQVVVTRPNGCVLVQGMPAGADFVGWVGRLAAVVPLDATWEVRPLDSPTPWDRDAHK